jgi:hypothetical protein
VQQLGGPRELGPSDIAREALVVGVVKAEDVDRRAKLGLVVAPIDIDPEEALRAQ